MATCVRFTMFPPGGPPVTVVAPEGSLKDSVGDTHLPSEGPMFVIKDVFQVDSDDLGQQTAVGMIRSQERQEAEFNMAVFYHWTIAKSFPLTKDGGTIAMTIPAPLTADELTYVHEALAKHEGYRNFRFVSLDADGEAVTYPELET